MVDREADSWGFAAIPESHRIERITQGLTVYLQRSTIHLIHRLVPYHPALPDQWLPDLLLGELFCAVVLGGLCYDTAVFGVVSGT